MELTPAAATKYTEKKDKKIRSEYKPQAKIRSEMKSIDKKIRAEDKMKGSKKVSKPVQINRSESSQSSTREILKPSRYVKDLMK
jgi:hypothetical protein